MIRFACGLVRAKLGARSIMTVLLLLLLLLPALALPSGNPVP